MCLDRLIARHQSVAQLENLRDANYRLRMLLLVGQQNKKFKYVRKENFNFSKIKTNPISRVDKKRETKGEEFLKNLRYLTVFDKFKLF